MYVCLFVGGPADGQLFPGDQILKLNNKAIEDLSPENVEQMIRWLIRLEEHSWNNIADLILPACLFPHL